MLFNITIYSGGQLIVQRSLYHITMMNRYGSHMFYEQGQFSQARHCCHSLIQDLQIWEVKDK